jgi:hypothetical protein
VADQVNEKTAPAGARNTDRGLDPITYREAMRPMSNATETTTTVPPCPSWCDAEQGHEYDTDIVSTGAIERHHN